MDNKFAIFLAPVGRVMISVIFLLSGLGKIFSFEQTQQYMESMGVAPILLIPTIILEITCSLAVIIGWQTRIAAAALSVFCVLAAVLFHSDTQNQMEMAMFLKNISIAGCLLFIVAMGPGSYSLDKK